VVLIADKYVSVWNQLKAMGLASWAVTEAVPDEAAEPLVQMLKYAAADDFGARAQDFAMTGAIGLAPPSIAERNLRQVMARAYVPHAQRTVYF
jgi:hypothetical protein